jgi:hypothetical protein
MGHVPACLFLADVLVKENQRAEAMRWLKRAEKQGSLDAHQMLQVLKYTRHGHIFWGCACFPSRCCVSPLPFVEILLAVVCSVHL